MQTNMLNKNTKHISKLYKNKKADVWISTVLYTLIGLAVIGILLSVIRPKLAEIKDSFTVDQTIASLNEFDKVINEVQRATGNSREYMLYLSRGKFIISAQQDVAEWLIEDSHYTPSEPGLDVYAGNVKILSVQKGDIYEISLMLNYSNRKANFTMNGMEDEKVLQPSRTSYSIVLENKGPLYYGGIQTPWKQIDFSVT